MHGHHAVMAISMPRCCRYGATADASVHGAFRRDPAARKAKVSKAKVLWRLLKHGLAGLLLVVAAVLAVRQGLVPLATAAFDLGPESASLLRRSGIFLAVLLAYAAWRRWVLPGPARDLRFRPLVVLAGGLAGAALISVVTLAGFVAGYYVVVAVPGGSPALLGVAGLIVIAAFMEEVVYRGVLFGTLEDGLGSTAAMWLQSLVFAAMHLSNAPASPFELATTMVAGTLIGALWTALYAWTRSLWVVTAHHAGWNFAIILTGLPLSGIGDWRALAPLESAYRGPAWLTGGVFGPEDALVCLVVVALTLAVFIRLAKRCERWFPAKSRRGIAGASGPAPGPA
jgi:membrane protease YdiL (CAAX protease family)